MNTWNALSQDISAAVELAAPSVVQVHGHRRVAAGVVIADNLIVTPAHTDEDKVAVLAGGSQPVEGVVLGRAPNVGLTVIRVEGLGRPALSAAAEPKPGQIAVAVGRTWSGGVMASFAPVAVIGGPLRTGRGSAIDRVIRIQIAPHGAITGGALIDHTGHALGIVTSMAIRGTTVVIPASIAWAAASKVASEGGNTQGFLGVSSLAVPLPERQRGGRPQQSGLLISHVAQGGPAESGGLLVGDVIVGFGGEPVQQPEELVTRLRSNRVGAAVPVTVIRGTSVVDVTVTVSERPTSRG
jgi:S1-C subfamily serine protease